jgi:cell wall-associated NlpC family hydrolase
MTKIDETAVMKRWRRRLKIRQNLLAGAERDFADAKGPERAAAKARVKLREEQVAYAKRVIDRHETPKLNARERAVRAAMLGVKHRDRISYTQGAGRWNGIQNGFRAYKGQFPKSADCSSFVTWCLWDALGGPKAGPDRVNGAAWKAGFTGTQCSHGRAVSRAEMLPGDLLFFRNAQGAIGHVTMYLGDGKAVSHGTDAGPQVVPVDYRPIAQIRRYLP